MNDEVLRHMEIIYGLRGKKFLSLKIVLQILTQWYHSSIENDNSRHQTFN